MEPIRYSWNLGDGSDVFDLVFTRGTTGFIPLLEIALQKLLIRLKLLIIGRRATKDHFRQLLYANIERSLRVMIVGRQPGLGRRAEE